MKKLLIIVLLLSFESCISENDKIKTIFFEEEIQIRQNILNNSFRYEVLSENGFLPDLKKIDDLFKKYSGFPKNKNAIKTINNAIDSLSKVFKINLMHITNVNSITETCLLNKLCIYDWLIFNSKNRNNNFDQLRPLIIKKGESKGMIKYNILLVAHDTLFKPAYSLVVRKDTFNIPCNKEGIGVFKVEKEKKNNQHELSGIVRYYDENGKEIVVKFSY